MPRITRRTFVAAPAETVWKLAGNFAEWHPKLRIYAAGPEASPELVVTVVARDESAMTLSYHMPDPPFRSQTTARPSSLSQTATRRRT